MTSKLRALTKGARVNKQTNKGGNQHEGNDAMNVRDDAMPTQKATLAWVAAQWPDRTTPIWRAGKLCEEAGETMGAVIKLDEGRKTVADIEQETAQVVICAMALAESVGFDLWDAVAAEYDRATAPKHEKITVSFEGGPWNGQTADIERVIGPVFSPGHEIGNHYWLDVKSDPPSYFWNPDV